MKNILTKLIISTFLVSFSMSSSATSRVTTCQIQSGGQTIFNGECAVHPKGERSFYLANKNPKKILFAQVMTVNFAVGEGAISNETIVTTTLSNGGSTKWGPVMKTSYPKTGCWTGTGKYINICINP